MKEKNVFITHEKSFEPNNYSTHSLEVHVASTTMKWAPFDVEAANYIPSLQVTHDWYLKKKTLNVTIWHQVSYALFAWLSFAPSATISFFWC